MTIGKRLKCVIKQEGMTQKAFAEAFQVPLRTLEDYISGNTHPSGELIARMGEDEQFRKYIIWLLTNHVEPQSGQVCPDFSTQEQCGLVKEDSQKQA